MQSRAHGHEARGNGGIVVRVHTEETAFNQKKNMREIKFRGFNRKELFLAVGAFAFAQVIKDMEG